MWRTCALRAPSTVVLLVNLGSPSSLTRRGIRNFLRVFLSDTRVISLSQYLWLPILYLAILPFRPASLLHKYKYVWRRDADADAGMSCLTYYSSRLASQLDAHLAQTHGPEKAKVVLAMRYGDPNVVDVLTRLDAPRDNVATTTTTIAAAADADATSPAPSPRRILVLPLFPQYSSTTTASIFDAVASFYATAARRRLPSMHFVRDYADHPAYVAAIASTLVRALCTHYHVAHDTHALARLLASRVGEVAIVFSYHSIPVQYAMQGDDYAHRCRATTDAVRGVLEKQLGIALDALVLQVYQSRFGNLPWLEPFLTDAVQTLPLAADTAEARAAKSAFAAKAGNAFFAEACVKTCFVIAPGFAVDCLETLHEIREEARELYLAKGGNELVYVDALNDSREHVEALTAVVQSNVHL